MYEALRILTHAASARDQLNNAGNAAGLGVVVMEAKRKAADPTAQRWNQGGRVGNVPDTPPRTPDTAQWRRKPSTPQPANVPAPLESGRRGSRGRSQGVWGTPHKAQCVGVWGPGPQCEQGPAPR